MFKFLSRKRRYFKRIVKDARLLVWETEFKKFTVLKLREETRRQYDQTQQALEAMNVQLKADPKNEEVLAQKLEMEKTADDMKAQMDAIDATLAGGPPSELHPEGVKVGLDQDLQNKVNRIASVKEFIKYNC